MASTYSFTDVVASLAGPTGSVQFGYGAAVADEGISIDPAGDKSSMTIAADGKGMHSLHADRSGTVTIRLLKTSPINQALQLMYDTQTASSALHGNNTITISHVTSGDLTVASSCAFKKKPHLVYAKAGNINEWTFDSLKIDTILGTY